MWLRSALALVLACSAATTARAEGSEELDVGDTSGTHDAHDQAVSTPTAIFVDIVSGTNEKICWRGTGTIAVRRPNNGAVVSAALATTSCVDAVNGVDGAYGITLGSNQVMGVEWDIRVCDKTVTNANCLNTTTFEKLGRLWSYTWDFEQNAQYGARYSVNGSVFAIVPGGAAGRDAVIEMQMRGVSGAFYKLFANNIGPETAGGTRIGRSITRTGNKVTPAYPLYLNPPNAAQYNWITPTITNVTLAPSCGSGIVLASSPGTISFTTNVIAQYVVVCDVNADGLYDFGSTTDFSSFGNTVVGANTVSWNGKNNAGTDATPGTYQCIVRVNVGEFHYVAEDIETSFPGIRMYRVESDKATRTAINMFWDDSGVTADNENMPAPASAVSPNSAVSTGLAPGAYATAPSAFFYSMGSPTGTARAWGNFDADGKGNNNFLDQFSAADTAQSPPFSITVFANAGDADGDTLTNARECTINTNPEDNDSDDDGVNDGFEASSMSAPNTDGDATIDALDPDDDGDGVSTKTELGGGENGDGNPNDAANSDTNGARDYLDVDSDNDGVCDGGSAVMSVCTAGPDSARTNPNACKDADADSCDDCLNTGANGSGGNPNNDGTDTDTDGDCNAGDPDDDNDGVCDGASAVASVCAAGPDTAPINANACGDTDGDSCDDCSSGSFDPSDDGVDLDMNGLCDAGEDRDGDGVTAAADLDDDNDGILDTIEDAAGTGLDNDGDGISNRLDLDSDNDGITDVVEAGAFAQDGDDDGMVDGPFGTNGYANILETSADSGTTKLKRIDTDGDGDDDFVDLDSDDDGKDDVDEVTALSTFDANDDGELDSTTDDDDDGLMDVVDDDDTAYGFPKPITDPLADDEDGDGIPAAYDLEDDGSDSGDSDGDGTSDEDECPTGRPCPDSNGDRQPDYTTEDADGDGLGDAADLDDDNDGILDTQENKPAADSDGVANRLDLDSDADGIFDLEESGHLARKAKDAGRDGRVDGTAGANGAPDSVENNAADSGNVAAPRDTDGDGKPDFLDTDSDGDGLSDADEAGDADPKTLPLDSDGDDEPNYVDVDDDGDGLSTTDELADEAAAGGDVDGDGRPAYLDTDSDGDGKSDESEGAADEDADGTPNYLDPTGPVVEDPDSDGDGLRDSEECATMPCQDSDGDGDPDFMDPDDDGDGLPTKDERPSDTSLDSDGDDKPDYLDTDDDNDGLPTADERPKDTSVDSDGDGTADFLDPDDDDDGVPTKDEQDAGKDIDTDGDGKPDHLDVDDDGDGILTEDEDVDANGNGKPDRLEPPVTGGTLAGGALCAVSAPGASHEHGSSSAWVLALGLLALLLRRRPSAGPRKKARSAASHAAQSARAPRATRATRATRAGVALSALALALTLLGSARGAHAQVALDQLKPAPLASDGFALSRPESLRHLSWGALLLLDYANDPLVFEVSGSGKEIHVVQDQLVVHVGMALGLFDTVTVFGMLPIDAVMSGENPGALAPQADGAGIGDLAFGGRIVLLGKNPEDSFALSGELIARVPTAKLVDSSQVYAGDQIGSYEPAIVAELRFGRFDVRLRPGVRLREQRRVGNLVLGPEFVYGLGARLRIADGFHAHAELFGASSFADFGKREQTPLELLLGGKYNVDDWFFGLGAGPGLAQGYGAPDLRVVGTIGYAPVAKPEGPKDTDGDGLLDPDDKCPLDPEDKDGFEDEEGCSDPDNDKDGIRDLKDSCPNDPEDKDEFEDENGCPDPDNDEDGILDVDDSCPNDPEDKDGFEDANGCPDPDNDKDKVLDVNDECPLTPGAVEAKGCPKSVRLDIETGRIMILDRVEFAVNKDVILESSKAILEEVAQTLNANPQLKRVRIEGHTDDVGKDAKNMDLSRRRARSVARWLSENGVDVERMEAFGCGENRPLQTGKTKAIRQGNRRVEFHIVDPAPAEPRDKTGCEELPIE